MPQNNQLVERVSIKCNGADLAPATLDALVDMRVARSLGVPAYARLAFRVETTGSGLSSDAITAKIGDTMSIEVTGSDSSSAPFRIFDGLVVSLGVELDSGTSQHVIIECYDALYKLGRKSVTKAYTEQTASDIIRSAAADAGLQVGSIEATRTRHDVTYQYATAYALVDRLVRDAGAEWFVDDNKLYVRKRSSTAAPHTLKVGENLRSFSARFSATEHVDRVKVRGWDPRGKQAIVGEATYKASASGSSNGLTAGSLGVVGGTETLTIPRPVVDAADAEQIARAIVDRRGKEMLRARGEAFASGAVKPGATLRLEGLGAKWNGDYYCTAVEFTFAGESLRMFFDVGPSEPDSLVDILGGAGTGPTLEKMLGSLTVGIVTNNNDSKGSMHRVKVKLPYLSDQGETGWARVLQSGAGSNRGWSVLPEVGDEVLVGFEHGDIDHPFVLGGLPNGTDVPKYAIGETVIGDKVVNRRFNSRLGHEIWLSDAESSADQFVQIHTAGKEATVKVGVESIEVTAKDIPITLSNNQNGSITMAANGDITIKGGEIKITATKDLTLEGANINIKSTQGAVKATATSTLDMKSNAGSTLESSAITTVKGTMVKIN